jgi:CubicO group peptidase (beta-lactamase class C family)
MRGAANHGGPIEGEDEMRNVVTRLLIAGAVLGLASAARADDTFCVTQGFLFDAYLLPKTSQSVGGAVVTLKLGEQPCVFFFGEIEKGSGVTPDINTVFELASVTKTFTTAILALRAGQGLKVDDPVKPHLPSGYVLTANEDQVTYQQLATFTGGFSWSYPPGFTCCEHFSQSDFVDAVNEVDPTDGTPIPGESNLPTVNHYSNGSIGFLGQILMHMDSSRGQQYSFDAAGFSKWILDNLTGPLLMRNTSVNPGGVWATGYNRKGDAQSPFPWEPWGAAGALRSTTADMLLFLEANICAHHQSDPQCSGFPGDVLTALAEAHRPNEYTPPGNLLADPTIYVGPCGSRVEQAWAWQYLAPPASNPNGDTPIISKLGGHSGFSSWIGFNPDKKYGLVILLNTGNIGVNAGLKMIQNTQ